MNICLDRGVHYTSVHRWELQAWLMYQTLMGNSSTPLCKSINPRQCAENELLNIELLLKEGKNQLITSCVDFGSKEIPIIYNMFINGNWNNFISIHESECFHKAELKYLIDNNFDAFNLTKENFKIWLDSPREKDFVNRTYIAAQEIQALLWYRTWIKRVIHERIVLIPYKFNLQANDDEVDGSKDKSKQKSIAIQNSKSDNAVIDPIIYHRNLLINFAKSVLIQHPNAKTADVLLYCFEDLADLESRNRKIIRNLLIEAGVTGSKVGEHSTYYIAWEDKYPKTQWVRVFRKRKDI